METVTAKMGTLAAKMGTLVVNVELNFRSLCDFNRQTSRGAVNLNFLSNRIIVKKVSLFGGFKRYVVYDDISQNSNAVVHLSYQVNGIVVVGPQLIDISPEIRSYLDNN